MLIRDRTVSLDDSTDPTSATRYQRGNSLPNDVKPLDVKSLEFFLIYSVHYTSSLLNLLISMDTKSIKELGFPEYWNRRYENASKCENATHEWFRSFEKLRPFLEKELPDPKLGPRILHLGCGDSVSKPRHAMLASLLMPAPQEPKLNSILT